MVLLPMLTAQLPGSSFIAVLCFACAFCACLLHCLGYLLLDFICGSFGASCASPTLSLILSLGEFLSLDYSLSVCMYPHWVLWWFTFLQHSLCTANFSLVSDQFWQLPILWFCFSLMLNCMLCCQQFKCLHRIIFPSCLSTSQGLRSYHHGVPKCLSNDRFP